MTYERGFVADKNTLKFSHDTGSRYQISNFIEGPVNGLLAFDVTSAADVKRVENGIVTGADPYTLEIETIDPAYAHRMALMPETEYDGNRKVTYTCDDFMENHHAFLTMVALQRTEFYVKPR